MGMYTEFIFLGETKEDIPENIRILLGYFFDGCSLPPHFQLPVNAFFNCPRWDQIGYLSSAYFTPFAIRHSDLHVRKIGAIHVFLRCDLKNYDNEIELFIDWIKVYMRDYRGWIWYEENEDPTIIKYSDHIVF